MTGFNSPLPLPSLRPGKRVFLPIQCNKNGHCFHLQILPHFDSPYSEWGFYFLFFFLIRGTPITFARHSHSRFVQKIFFFRRFLKYSLFPSKFPVKNIFCLRLTVPLLPVLVFLYVNLHVLVFIFSFKNEFE